MSEKFEGICIGGPNDGRSMAHWEPCVRVPEWPPMSLRPHDPDESSETVEIREHIYRYEPMRFGRDGKEKGFWLHGDLTMWDAMARLIQNYAASTGNVSRFTAEVEFDDRLMSHIPRSQYMTMVVRNGIAKVTRLLEGHLAFSIRRIAAKQPQEVRYEFEVAVAMPTEPPEF